jgi:hypothetical protein
MRVFWIGLGIILLAFGAMAVTLAIIAVVVRGANVFILAVVPAVFVTAVALLILLKIPYRVVSADDGLRLSFAFRSESVAWRDVRSFRKRLVRMSFSGGEGMLYTTLAYVTQQRSPSWAILLLSAHGPNASLSPNDYESDLDRYIPHKNRRSLLP